MGLTLKELYDVLSWGNTINEGLSKQAQAEKSLGDACNDYVNNPTAENRATVRQAYKDKSMGSEWIDNQFNLTVRSNSSKSSGLKSRQGSCPYAPVA